jgi:hypothetical protein
MKRIVTYEIVGGWMLLVSFLNLPENYEMWNDVGVGFILTFLGVGFIKEDSTKGWITTTLGIWLIIAAFVPSLLTEPGSSWNALIVSLILIYLGFHLYSFSNKDVDSKKKKSSLKEEGY